MEYQAIVDFVKSMAEKDSRFQIITPGKNIRLMLEEKGYPFKSKVHSDIVRTYQNSGFETKTVQKYADAETTAHGRFHCPKCLLYQFTPDFNIPISAHCCRGLKKEPFRRYEKETGRTLGITGVRAAEGGAREYQALGGCVFRDKKGGIHRFAPLSPVSDEFMSWYIETRHIQLCSLYYPPYNFKRTGCKGCPYNIKIRETLDTMQELLPAEWKQCWILWEPIYKEYKRIGYRKMKDAPEPV